MGTYALTEEEQFKWDNFAKDRVEVAKTRIEFEVSGVTVITGWSQPGVLGVVLDDEHETIGGSNVSSSLMFSTEDVFNWGEEDFKEFEDRCIYLFRLYKT